jgi:hypothetical protein
VNTVEEFRPKLGPEMTRSKGLSSPETWCKPIFVQVDGVPAHQSHESSVIPFSNTQLSGDCSVDEVAPVLGS